MGRCDPRQSGVAENCTGHVREKAVMAKKKVAPKKVAKKKEQDTDETEGSEEEGNGDVDLNEMDYTVESDSFPAFLDDEGVLLRDVKLSRTDFGTNKAGKVAFCDYRIAVYAETRRRTIEGKSPKEKLQDRIDRGNKQLAAMKKKLADLEKETAESDED